MAQICCLAGRRRELAIDPARPLEEPCPISHRCSQVLKTNSLIIIGIQRLAQSLLGNRASEAVLPEIVGKPLQDLGIPGFASNIAQAVVVRVGREMWKAYCAQAEIFLDSSSHHKSSL